MDNINNQTDHFKRNNSIVQIVNCDGNEYLNVKFVFGIKMNF